jgi:hypothetical protein
MQTPVYPTATMEDGNAAPTRTINLKKDKNLNL